MPRVDPPHARTVRNRTMRDWAVAVSLWAPVVAKAAAGVLAALVLALIGVRAGTHALGPATAQASLGDSPSPAARPAGDPPLPLPAGAASDAGAESPATLPDGRVVLNLAGEADLVRLPGIGPARARAILELRARLTRFRSVEQLRRVKGIGRKTLQKIAPKVVIDPPRMTRVENDAG